MPLQTGGGTDLAQFGLGDSRFLMWRIAKPRIPRQAPRHSQQAEHEERRPPTIANLNRHDEEGRQRRADLTGHPDGAPGPRAFGSRDPASDDRGGIRIGACLAGSETESHQQQDVIVRHRPGECREGGPPGDDAREDAARPNAISQRASRYFECAVRKKKDARDPAPGFGADVQRILHARAGNGDADAVQIGNTESSDSMPSTRCWYFMKPPSAGPETARRVAGSKRRGKYMRNGRTDIHYR
jgi:hypothetical protein